MVRRSRLQSPIIRSGTDPIPENDLTQVEGELRRLGAALADRYRIERELGHGGMATVLARMADAIAACRRGLDLDPNSYLDVWALACALGLDRQYEAATVEGERALARSGRHVWALTTLPQIFARWGKPAQAQALFREVAELGFPA
jgi:tetratricopeptide (TPR) repeat protein